jgi:hypothetical protein
LKPKRRGRGDARAPLDEGNGGGTSGASLPLPPSTGGHPMATHGSAGRGGGGSGVQPEEEEGAVGWLCRKGEVAQERRGRRSRPVAKISKEMTWAIKVNRAELTMCCGKFFSQFSNKDLGFKIKDLKFQTKIELNSKIG